MGGVARHHLSSSVEAEIFDELDRIAEREGESRSEIVNRLLREAIEQRERAQFVEAGAQAAAGTASLTVLFVTANLLLANLYSLGL